MSEKKQRSSNIELLRILCMLFIIADHFTGQSGIRQGGSFGVELFYTAADSLSRMACSVFIIISAWFGGGNKPFRVEKPLQLWLTAFMYLVPLTALMVCRGMAPQGQLLHAFFPIEGGYLWFVSAFLLLQFLAPALRLLVLRQRRLCESLLLLFGVLMVAFTTLTARQGIFTNELWPLLYIYILTLYWKTYIEWRPKSTASALFFLLLWAALLLTRLWANKRGLTTLMAFGDCYRSRLQSLPNMALAYGIFFAFSGLRMRPSRLVNSLASCTLGVYCFHQVPVWYGFLWYSVLRSGSHRAMLSPWGSVCYSLAAILTVALTGSGIELLRSRLSALLIEERDWYKRLCGRVNDFVNERVSV